MSTPSAPSPKESLSRTSAAGAVRAKKSLGQHFLRDRGALERIVQAAGLAPEDHVLEIGAGDGTLTRALAASGASVVAVETDRRRIPRLLERFPLQGPVEIVEADILRFDLGRLAPLAPIKCVANLPYNVATAVLDRLLERRGMFSLLVLMFQKEVAQRLVAGPKDPAYGSLSLATQYRAEATLLFTVPRTAFVPPPKVESAVVRLVPRPAPLLEPAQEEIFEHLLRAGFAHRRKTFLNSAAGSGRPVSREALETGLKELGLTERARAEEIPLEGFLRLAALLGR